MSLSNQSVFQIRPRLRRRDLLLGMAAAGGLAALTTLGYRSLQKSEEDTTEMRVPFWGIHQSGVSIQLRRQR